MPHLLHSCLAHSHDKKRHTDCDTCRKYFISTRSASPYIICFVATNFAVCAQNKASSTTEVTTKEKNGTHLRKYIYTLAQKKSNCLGTVNFLGVFFYCHM